MQLNNRKFLLPDWFFFILLIGLSITFFRILSPYLIDIFFAVILTHLFRKVFLFFHHKTKLSANLSSLISMLLAIVVIIIPLFLVGLLISNEAINAFLMIKTKLPLIQEQFEQIQQMPYLTRISQLMNEFNLPSQLTQFMSTSAGFFVNLTQQIFLNIGFKLFHLIIILILMYFLLVDGPKLFDRILYLSPLSDKEDTELLNEVIKITDATLIGTVIIGLIEGIYGGIIFAIFGIHSPLFWGMIMMLFSMIPIIGINSILIPTGIVFMLSGQILSGFLIIILSYVGTTVTQNYLKPYLVSRRGGLHPALVLLSTIGGLSYFGLAGFLIGPVFASLFISAWNQFGRKYKSDLDQWNTA